MSVEGAPETSLNTPTAESTPGIRSPAWLKKHSLAMFIALVAIGSLRIVSTYTVFSHTWDEPDHIAAGTEWLTNGTMEIDFSHPPLARVAAALGPYLASGRPPFPYWVHADLSKDYDRPSVAGLAILHRDGAYDRNLALARLGILPFFWIASLTVYLWARRCLGDRAALFAVFFFTFLPPVLAHAGLATTDMALTALVGASFLMALIWIEKPDVSSSLLLGVVTGLAVLSKFSALPFIPVALAAAFVWHIVVDRPALADVLPVRRQAAGLGVALLTCCIIVWAGYRFSFGLVTFRSYHAFLPAPEFFRGIVNLLRYNRRGFPAFLLGKYSFTGWWYFFLVTLAVKTPLPFLVFTLFGAAAVATRNKGVGLALAFSLGILLFSLTSNLNLGIRHILPVYIGFSIVAAAGAERLLALAGRLKWTGWALSALIVWMAVVSCLSHPDYLPYFNVLAGNKPQNILIDSDLDWGQDVKRLGQRLNELGAPSVAFTSYQPVDLAAMGFPPVSPVSFAQPAPGWNAVSLTLLKRSEEYGNPMPWQEWIVPRERIGKGIWLWYFPPNALPGK